MSALQRQLIALLFCSLAFGARAESLHLVTEAWAPYVYEHNGEPVGLDYEITREVLRRLDIGVTLQFLPWKRALLALDQGQADGILDIFRLAERESQMVYISEPLSEVQFVLFFARNRPYPYAKLDDLRDLLIGTSPGYWYNNGAFRNSKLFNREDAPSHEANFGKLVRHRVDLVINDRRAGSHLAAQMGLGGQLGYNSKALGNDALYLALRRTPEMEELAMDFADELQRFKREARYTELQTRYAEPADAPIAAASR